jgi:hypothetical protein
VAEGIGPEFKPPYHKKKKTQKTTKKLLHIINSFSKVAGYKINIQKPVAFLYTNNEQIEKEYRKTIPFIITLKNKTPKNKLNKGNERHL